MGMKIVPSSRRITSGEPFLAQALAHPGPALIDVVVNRQELSMPPTVTMAQALGFNLYLLKAVINGKGDEIVDLAKTNLFSRIRR